MNEKAIVYKLKAAIAAGMVFTVLYAGRQLFGGGGSGVEAALVVSGLALVVFSASFLYLFSRYLATHL